MDVQRLKRSVVSLVLLLGAPLVGATAASAAEPILIGVAMPHAQLGQGSSGTDVGAPLQQNLVNYLHGPAVEVVALDSRIPQQIDAEAAAKHCNYVLQTTVTHKHTTSLGGLLRSVAPFASALPIVGAVGGGGAGNMAAAAVAQSAMSASAMAAQQQAMQQMTGAQQSNIKSGDTITLEYQLQAPGAAAPLKSEKLEAKAKADGEDLLGPLLEKVASNVVGAATGQAPVASLAPKPAPPGMGPAGSSGPAPGGMPAGMDCAQLARMPGSIMTVDSCKKMMASQQSYQTATTDPSASRPGDEKMTCPQIMAELKQQQYAAPDQAKLADAQAAAQATQARLAQRQAEIQRDAAVQQAAINTAMASDTATTMATGGAVQPQTASHLEQRLLDENAAKGERNAREDAATHQRTMAATADLSSGAGAQLQNNPRLARLVQLAGAKNCTDH